MPSSSDFFFLLVFLDLPSPIWLLMAVGENLQQEKALAEALAVLGSAGSLRSAGTAAMEQGTAPAQCAGG